jgi:hypothetical protein
MVISYILKSLDKDTTVLKKEFKNTVRLNISTPLIFGDRNLIFGYERMVGHNQSFSVNFGAFGLPNFISESDSLTVSRKEKNKGFNVSVDYRIYLTSENRYHAPHGLYIGPYYSFNHMFRENTWMFDSRLYTGNIDATLDINVHTAGVELGYQFIFFKRLALDLVLTGPGIANYSLKIGTLTNLAPQQRNELLTAIAQNIKEKIPVLNNALNGQSYKENSGVTVWDIGYRYLIHVGYRF